MKWHYAAAIAVAVLSVTAALGEDAPTTPAAKLEAIQKDVKDVEAAFKKAWQALQPDTPEYAKKWDELYQAFIKKQADGFMAALDLAKADPKSDAAFDALEWVLTSGWAYRTPAAKTALELATQHCAANPKIGKAVAYVDAYFPRGEDDAADKATTFLQAVATKNPDHTARGQAVLGLAIQVDANFTEAEYKNSTNVEQLAAKAEKALEGVVKDYGDCPLAFKENSGTVGERAKQGLFELQHLRVGKVAPEIEGEDLDGKKFKLSDYRGKVVMLNFWGHW